MTKTLLQTLEELSSVGDRAVSIRLNRDIFPEDLVRRCANNHAPILVAAEHGAISIQPDIASRDVLRQFAAALIAALRQQT